MSASPSNPTPEDPPQGEHLLRDFIRVCRKRGSRSKIVDSMGQSLTGSELLLRSLVFRRTLRRVLDRDEERVGVLMPPSAPGVLVNAALALDRRVAVNLNYTVSSSVLNDCIRIAGIRHVLTSRRVLSKLNLELAIEPTYLEDLRGQVTLADKVLGAAEAYSPEWLLSRMLGLHQTRGDDVLTIIFTSGSTGTPKGVMLTKDNIRHNVASIDRVVRLRSTDVLVGLLPLFHSFGYTVTLWSVLSLDIQGAYHFSPIDAKGVGRLIEKVGGTLLLATPTFLRSYLKRCTVEQFQTLDVVVAGAEKLPAQLSDAFEAKFGVRPVEGYGTTELSPLVSVNVPPSRATQQGALEAREGSVGRPIPGVQAKTVDPDSGADRNGKSGLLCIKGPNVMKGYLDRDDLTHEAIHDGWYSTGDIAEIDDDGFIHITGRQSRFSKIGGEMVPHLRVEEVLADILGGSEEDGLQAAVTAVPDERKGERLVVVHTKIDKTPEELCRGLAEAGLPNLFIPSADSFVEVPTMPVLGTGKLDLKGIKDVALERFGG